jgi:hypothetical protein
VVGAAVDDLYHSNDLYSCTLGRAVSYAHEQKGHTMGCLSIGVAMMANKKALFVTLVDRTP